MKIDNDILICNDNQKEDYKNIILGYKVLNNDLSNRYGFKFKEGKIYEVDVTYQDIVFGNDGYGIHFTERLEDGLRYFDGLKQKINIVQVQALGDIKSYYDEYYGYYDLYVTSKIYIKHILSREEIINYILNTDEDRLIRFIKGFRLEDKEINIIQEVFKSESIDKVIRYYQKNEKDVYNNIKKLVYK